MNIREKLFFRTSSDLRKADADKLGKRQACKWKKTMNANNNVAKIQIKIYVKTFIKYLVVSYLVIEDLHSGFPPSTKPMTRV